MVKISVLATTLVLVLAMITANVFNGSLILAKEDAGSSGGSGSSDTGSSKSGDTNTGGNDNDGGGGNTASPSKPENNDNNQQPPGNTAPNTGQGIDERTGLPKAEPKTDVPLSPNPIIPSCLTPADCHSPSPNPSPNTPDNSCAFNPDSPKCHPDKDGNCPPGFSHNVHGNCFPSGKCPSGFGRHDNDETGKCFRNPGSHFPSHGHTRVIVKEVHHTTTKVVHKNQISGIATVFVPKVGLVEPFNCKLNSDNGKIGCEFLIVKVIK